MAHYLSLNRMSRLTGVPRARLQQMAGRGELNAFEGMVELGEVLRAFPDIRLEDDSEIERLEEIKAAAVRKSSAVEAVPDPRALDRRIDALGRDFAAAKVKAEHFQMVLDWTLARLRELVDDGIVGSGPGFDLIERIRREIALEPDDRRRRERLIALESRLRIMSAQARLLPKGHVFEVSGRETLLEAGVRAGLSLPYGCSNGNCGECKARVTSGETLKVRPHDYRLSEAEKAEGYILTCSYTAVGDVTLETEEPGVDDIPVQSLRARVRKVDRLGDRFLALHVLTGPGERMRFVAGQRIVVETGGVAVELPVASCPCEERRIEVQVPVGSSDAAARIATLKAGEEVGLTGPYGRFVLDDGSERPLILAALGNGFGPIKSLLQHALALDDSREIVLVAARDSAAALQENLLRAYAASLDQFAYSIVEPEKVAAAIAGAAGAELRDMDLRVAGPASAVEAIRAELVGLGLPLAQFAGEDTG